MRVLALLSFSWSHLAAWAAAGVGAVAAAAIVASLLRGRFSPPPTEAVLVVGAVVCASYIDVEFGSWLAGTLGLCALAVGILDYVRGRNLDNRARAHTTPEEWAAHFAADGTCPCADATVKRPGERGARTPTPAGCSTSLLGPMKSATRRGLVPGDAGRPENARPDANGERQADTPPPVDAPFAARHHVSVSDPAAVAQLGGDVVPHPRFKSAEPVRRVVDETPTFHVTGSVAALAEAG